MPSLPCLGGPAALALPVPLVAASGQWASPSRRSVWSASPCLLGSALTLNLSQEGVPKTSNSHHFRPASALATVTRDTTQGAPRQPGQPPLPNWLRTAEGLKGSPEGRGWGGVGRGWGGAEWPTLRTRGVKVWAPGLAPQLAYLVVNGVTITMP